MAERRMESPLPLLSGAHTSVRPVMADRLQRTTISRFSVDTQIDLAG